MSRNAFPAQEAGERRDADLRDQVAALTQENDKLRADAVSADQDAEKACDKEKHALAELRVTTKKLAAMTQERDELNHEFGGEHRLYLACKRDLAAAQAHAQQLREALEEVISTIENDDSGAIVDTIWVSDGSPETLVDYGKRHLAIPFDTAALRQHDAKLLREMADKLTISAHPSLQLLQEADELEAASEVMKGRT